MRRSAIQYILDICGHSNAFGRPSSVGEVRALVTGASGFLGLRLIQRLLHQGHEVIALLRPGTVNPINDQYSQHIRTVYCDLSDFSGLVELKNIDAVFTLAQERHFRDFPRTAHQVLKVNVEANVKIWEWASRNDVRKLIHASSGGIYGPGSGVAFAEHNRTAPVAQTSFYLGSKLCAEIALQSFLAVVESVVVVRPFFLYGPGQQLDMFIQRMITNVSIGAPVSLGGRDGIRTNPIFIDDAADLFAKALTTEGSYVTNCAGLEVVTLRQLCEEIGRHIGRPPVFSESNQVTSDCIGDTTLQVQRFGEPKINLGDGLSQTIRERHS